jgi:hypothetical protein
MTDSQERMVRASMAQPRVITDDPGVQVAQAPASLQVNQAIAELRRFEEIDREAVARGESANWWERGGGQDVTGPHSPDVAAALMDLAELRTLLASYALTVDDYLSLDRHLVRIKRHLDGAA